MIIHHGEPCISCEHYSADTSDENHWICDFDHDTCPHIEALHNAVGYKERIDAEVLDKIREEIEEYRDAMPWENKSVIKWEAINYILEQIIDKYREPTVAEREE